MRALLGTFLVLSIFTTNLFAETIRITNGEWEPFLSKYTYQYGFSSHIVTEAFKLEGITVEWGFFPWQRAYQNAKSSSDWDASCCWWPDKAVEQDFLFSDTITETSLVFFHLKSFNFQWNSLQDLKGIKIGGTLNYDYGKKITDAISAKTLEIDFALKDEFNYKKLLAGRIQLFLNDPSVGKAQILNSLSVKEAGLITYNPKKFGKNTIHFIIRKNHPQDKYFIDKFNAGMKKLKKSGRYIEMLKDFEKGKYNKKTNITKQ